MGVFAKVRFGRLVRLGELGETLKVRALCFCLSMLIVPIGVAKPLSEAELRSMFAKEMPKIFDRVAPPGQKLDIEATVTRRLFEPKPLPLSQIDELHLIGPEHKAKEVVLVGRRSSLDEIHAFWQVFKTMGSMRPHLHIIAAKDSGLTSLRIPSAEFRQHATVDEYVQAGDPWLRDCAIPVALKQKGVVAPLLALLDPLRGGELKPVPWALCRRWSAPRVLPPGIEAEWGGNNGGNFLVTPDGIAIIGGNCSPSMRDFVTALGYRERVILADMWWRYGSLGGGHVDEIVTVLPVPADPNGYVIAFPDPTLGLSLLQSIPKERIIEELENLLASLYQLRHLYPQSFSKEEAVLGMKMAEEVGMLYGSSRGR